MAVVSIMPQAEIGPNDHRQHVPHFISFIKIKQCKRNTSLRIEHDAATKKCPSNSPEESTVDWLEFTLKENIWCCRIAKKIIKINFVQLNEFLIRFTFPVATSGDHFRWLHPVDLKWELVPFSLRLRASSCNEGNSFLYSHNDLDIGVILRPYNFWIVSISTFQSSQQFEKKIDFALNHRQKSFAER